MPKLNRCIKANLSNEHFGVEQLATEMGMSRSNLYRKLQKTTGKNISRYIRELRLIEAHKLLCQTDLNTSEVAYRVGFSSVSYFSKCFSKHFTYPPSKAKYAHNDVLPNPKKEASKSWSKSVWKEGIVIPLREAISFFSPTRRSRLLPTISLNRRRVIVFPFNNLNVDDSEQYLTVSLVHAISRYLSHSKELDVIHNEVGGGSSSIQEINKKLKVTHLLQGSLQKAKNTYRIEVRLIEAQTGKHVWCNKYDRPTCDILKLQTDIAKHIAQALRINLVLKEKLSVNEIG